ncbi:guanine nucleotide-binding protein-like 1 [Anaeramoeba flamelloides]|uniref:Guanine nucleotide-binding protein-like 1 n=1 Tax=Anaeramoeba flamelloides TaxID=1746091 RepID=A0ABQ8YDE9_9EUKA|nr:guanine nucleotide-binding protein-like 1 [Anaeramoeba flamelloides]
MNKTKKKPFSGKKKKQQLKQKRQRKKLERETGERVLTTQKRKKKKPKHKMKPTKKKKNQPKTKKKKNTQKLMTVFEKETREEVLKRKEFAKEPLVKRWDQKDSLTSLSELFQSIQIPIRPDWKNKDPKELDEQEQKYFRQYLNDIKKKFGEKEINNFEHNLEVWRQLWRVVERSDILLLITDSRYPLFHFSESLYNYIIKDIGKPLILVLNKIDLVSDDHLIKWRQFFQNKFPKLKIVFFSCKPRKNRDQYDFDHNKKHKRKKNAKKGGANGVDELLDCCKEIYMEHYGENNNKLPKNRIQITNWRTLKERKKKIRRKMNKKKKKNQKSKNKNKFDDDYEIQEGDYNNDNNNSNDDENDDFFEHDQNYIIIGTVGHPNCGKSSLLNAILGKTKISVSKTPGHTKHFQTHFINKQICVMDCPGLVFPVHSIKRELQVVCGIYPIAQVREPYSAIRFVAERIKLHEIYKLEFVNDYSEPVGLGTDKDDWTPWKICESYAIQRGFFYARNSRPDTHRAAQSILSDIVEGVVLFDIKPPLGGSKKMLKKNKISTEIENVDQKSNENSDEESNESSDEKYNEKSEIKIDKKYDEKSDEKLDEKLNENLEIVDEESNENSDIKIDKKSEEKVDEKSDENSDEKSDEKKEIEMGNEKK